MLRTILVLIGTLIALPLIAFRYDAALSPDQWMALEGLFSTMLIIALTCFVVSELSQNYSQVDKLWSIVPILYTWMAAWYADFSPRLVLMAVLATLWGIRLTYNFGRRGGYHWIPWKGEEDYRWSVLRKDPPLNRRPVWVLFNLLFISLYQHSLILLFTLPTIVAWQGADRPLGGWDYFLAALFVGLVVMETIADQQQYDFQQEKYRRINAGLPLEGIYAKGFCAEGLWGRMRHPNYAAEQSIWLVFYLFSVVATGRWVNWSLAGVILLMLLFLGSSDFSEKISAGKYPGYADYQKKVSRFVPKLGK